jgi:hypothetical protein
VPLAGAKHCTCDLARTVGRRRDIGSSSNLRLSVDLHACINWHRCERKSHAVQKFERADAGITAIFVEDDIY